MRAEIYNLPDGSCSHDRDTYLAAWRALCAPVERMGLRLVGFDPGALFHDPETNKTLDLPVWFLRRFIEDRP